MDNGTHNGCRLWLIALMLCIIALHLGNIVEAIENKSQPAIDAGRG